MLLGPLDNLRRSLLAVLLLAGICYQPSACARLLLPAGVYRQGQTVEVLVDEIDPLSPPEALELNGQTFKLFAAPVRLAPTNHEITNSTLCTLLPIPATMPPGKYQLRCGPQSAHITVVSGKFPVQRLTLPKSKDNFEESPGEQEAVDKAKSTITPERLWQGAFTAPSPARTSAGFGIRRIVNGKLLADYFHSGLDFAGSLGSPVKATADGKVILAKQGFRLHGNTVAIDHGQGVISFYIHLQKILVKPNQIVKGGDLIGKIGQSGRANGPHLHFSIYVSKIATNPRDWFKQYF